MSKFISTVLVILSCIVVAQCYQLGASYLTSGYGLHPIVCGIVAVLVVLACISHLIKPAGKTAAEVEYEEFLAAAKEWREERMAMLKAGVR